ncbi:MAG: AI-2E family transporter [Rickettsiales bacterium]|nr:MAG: AI-2E family transporter [Rickettsiales bacterium]
MLIYDKFKNNKDNILKYGLVFLSLITLYKIKDVLTPFVLGFICAYIFKNMANKLEKKFHKRDLISILIVLIFWVLITLFFFYLIPFLIGQSIDIGKELINFFNIHNDTINKEINNVTKYFHTKIDIKEYINSYFKDFDSYLLSFLNNVFSTSIKIVNALYVFIMTPIVMYYFLNDWNSIITFLKKYFPFCGTKKSITFFKSIDVVLTACIKEQFYVCFLLGVYYSILLLFIDLKYGILLGLLSGFATFIPYVGIIAGLVIALIMGFYQFGNDIFLLTMILTIFLSGLLLEMNWLLPAIVGKKINLHPLWVLFALIASGALMGFFGLLFALPLAGCIGVIIRFYFQKK